MSQTTQTTPATKIDSKVATAFRRVYKSQDAMEENSKPPAAESVPSASSKVAKGGQDDLIATIIEPQVAPPNGNSKDSQSQLLVNLAKGFTSFFHTPDGDAFASLVVNDHIETLKVQSSDFRQWLGRLFYKESGKPPGAQAIKDALTILGAEAKFDGPEIPTHLRYAWYNGSIYIDLCDRSWNQVHITPGGWKVIGSKDSPVKFFRAQGMLPMQMPEPDGAIDLLRRYLNIEDDSGWVMIVSWLIGSMRPSGPFPILVLQGEQGTAKSTTARLLKDLLDPSAVPSQSLPRSERDLAIAASKSWVLNFDNLSYIKPVMSDAFCRLSTGGGFRTRALYTDDNERLFNSIRPMIMNGITDLATRHDLADRSLIVQLPIIPKEKRLPEKELITSWDRSKGKLLGALCYALSAALGNMNSVKLPYLPRMADFALWATAAEPAFGWDGGSFMREYENNQKALVGLALEADPVAIAIIRLIKGMQAHEWHGTASELLNTLNTLSVFTHDLVTAKSWPRKANVLSGQLRRAAPSLREIGIEVQWTKSGDRFIHIIPTEAFNIGDGQDRSGEHGAEEYPDLPDPSYLEEDLF